MIYTIGHRESYEKGFEEFKYNLEDFKKMGKCLGYVGGSVFRTHDDAKAFLKNSNIDDFEVYGVEADWLLDSEENEHGEFNNLLVDAQLIKLL
jgi:hypothetical protein